MSSSEPGNRLVSKVFTHPSVSNTTIALSIPKSESAFIYGVLKNVNEVSTTFTDMAVFDNGSMWDIAFSPGFLTSHTIYYMTP